MPGTPVALANDDSGADHERSTVAQANWTSMVRGAPAYLTFR